MRLVRILLPPQPRWGQYWAEETAKGHINTAGRPLIFVEPEGEHAAAGVTAGMSMSGLRASNFSSGQGIAYMHESLYAAVGKRLPYILNIGCRAITKSTLNVHAGHDDYHLMDDTGFIQTMAKNAQEAADLNPDHPQDRRAVIDARRGRPGRLPDHTPHRDAQGSGARANRGVPRVGGRHYRHPNARPGTPLWQDPAPRAQTLGCR